MYITVFLCNIRIKVSCVSRAQEREKNNFRVPSNNSKCECLYSLVNRKDYVLSCCHISVAFTPTTLLGCHNSAPSQLCDKTEKTSTTSRWQQQRQLFRTRQRLTADERAVQTWDGAFSQARRVFAVRRGLTTWLVGLGGGTPTATWRMPSSPGSRLEGTTGPGKPESVNDDGGRPPGKVTKERVPFGVAVAMAGWVPSPRSGEFCTIAGSTLDGALAGRWQKEEVRSCDNNGTSDVLEKVSSFIGKLLIE